MAVTRSRLGPIPSVTQWHTKWHRASTALPGDRALSLSLSAAFSPVIRSGFAATRCLPSTRCRLPRGSRQRPLDWVTSDWESNRGFLQACRSCRFASAEVGSLQGEDALKVGSRGSVSVYSARVGSTSGAQVLPGRGPRDGSPDRRLVESRTAHTTPVEALVAPAASSRSIDSNPPRCSSAVFWMPIAPSSPSMWRGHADSDAQCHHRVAGAQSHAKGDAFLLEGHGPITAAVTSRSARERLSSPDRARQEARHRCR